MVCVSISTIVFASVAGVLGLILLLGPRAQLYGREIRSRTSEVIAEAMLALDSVEGEQLANSKGHLEGVIRDLAKLAALVPGRGLRMALTEANTLLLKVHGESDPEKRDLTIQEAEKALIATQERAAGRRRIFVS